MSPAMSTRRPCAPAAGLDASHRGIVRFLDPSHEG